VRRLGGLGLLLVLLLVAAAPAQAAEAQITAERNVEPRVVELTIATPAFTAPTHVLVDLPNGYEAEPGRRWPVSYFLAGTQNTYKSFNNVVHGVDLTESFPGIVVSPNGDSGYWSNWYNGGAFGPPEYETYVVEQLIPLIDRTFRTIPERAGRAIAGVSMGGYGSMMIAVRHPDLFAYAASISGADNSNNPLLGAALSASSTFDGGAVDAINGPRATQEVRWLGHNPTTIAANLRGLDLQVRTANGVINPAIGEDPLSVDLVSCPVEAGVHQGSVDLNARLEELGIPHLWKDYGPGCHTPENFEREVTDTLATFVEEFADPPAPPTPFDYESIEPQFSVWGWQVSTDASRALEFMRLANVDSSGLKLTGSGRTAITSPPIFGEDRAVVLTGAQQEVVVPDEEGRIWFTVDLGPADKVQEYTPGADPAEVTRTVRFHPLPRVVDPTAPGQATAGEADEGGGGGDACVVPKLRGRTVESARRRLGGAIGARAWVGGSRARGAQSSHSSRRPAAACPPARRCASRSARRTGASNDTGLRQRSGSSGREVSWRPGQGRGRGCGKW
jgi:S-formylglutathione hydrolase FrmB